MHTSKALTWVWTEAQNVRFQTFCAKELANRCPPQPANFFKSSSKKNLPNHLTYWYFDSILTNYAIYMYIYCIYIYNPWPQNGFFWKQFGLFPVSHVWRIRQVQHLWARPHWAAFVSCAWREKKRFAAAAAWCISVSPVGKRNFHIRRCWLASRSMSREGQQKRRRSRKKKEWRMWNVRQEMAFVGVSSLIKRSEILKI